MYLLKKKDYLVRRIKILIKRNKNNEQLKSKYNI